MNIVYDIAHWWQLIGRSVEKTSENSVMTRDPQEDLARGNLSSNLLFGLLRANQVEICFLFGVTGFSVCPVFG